MPILEYFVTEVGFQKNLEKFIYLFSIRSQLFLVCGSSQGLCVGTEKQPQLLSSAEDLMQNKM